MSKWPPRWLVVFALFLALAAGVCAIAYGLSSALEEAAETLERQEREKPPPFDGPDDCTLRERRLHNGEVWNFYDCPLRALARVRYV